jgi:hypothetical protein
MRYAVVLLAVFGLVLVGCGGGTPEEKMEKAKAALEEGDFDKAIDLAKDAADDEGVDEAFKAAADLFVGTAEAAKKAAELAEDLVPGD